ncbi:MAG: hypothetical protein R6U15_04850 [Candidatus Izemoplasmatales bacterium]
MIQTGSTGTPKDFAKKLNVSVSTLYELLSCLKELGACFHYNRDKLTHVFENSSRLICKLEMNELQKVSGGNFIQLQFFRNNF